MAQRPKETTASCNSFTRHEGELRRRETAVPDREESFPRLRPEKHLASRSLPASATNGPREPEERVVATSDNPDQNHGRKKSLRELMLFLDQLTIFTSCVHKLTATECIQPHQSLASLFLGLRFVLPPESGRVG